MSERESKILVKSPKPRNKAQTKVDHKIMVHNYVAKLSASILCRAKVSELLLFFKLRIKNLTIDFIS